MLNRCNECKKLFPSWTRSIHYCSDACRVAGRKKVNRKAFDKFRPKRNASERRFLSNPRNREKRMAYLRDRNLKIKEETVEAYGSICSCCGEDEIKFLTLDHSNGDGGKHRRELFPNGRPQTGVKFYCKLKNLGYPQDLGLVVLCQNCHLAKDKYGICPHVEYEAYVKPGAAAKE